MPFLSMSLMGPLHVTLEGQPVTRFKSDKVRALLAYLAVEAERPHPREVLTGMLWPEMPEVSARSNLRDILSNLRSAIGDRDAEPPFLLISRESVQFHTASHHWLDVAAFESLLAAETTPEPDTARLEEAVALYRGSFLEGFGVGDSAAFEDWALFTRERLAREMSTALHRLSAAFEERREYERAQSAARRLLELEPWDEVAHQRLMRSLALGNQRSAALAQYQACCRLLDEELDVQPARETTRLYEQIRDGQLEAATLPPRPPSAVTGVPPFLERAPREAERALFVARERELAQLDGFLDLALDGEGRVVFVIGEAGSGKTALMQEFARRALETHADGGGGPGRALVVAGGNCSAYTGIGDPYLPFREILALLAGDIEARWAAGAMTREHVRRLWQTFPLTAHALLEAGLDLIDAFVPRAVLERAMASAHGGADWPARLQKYTAHSPTGPSMPSPQQSDLFEQYTRVLQELARQVPLLLLVDDLQWADLGSIGLLFHLGRQLAGSRILIVGAFRPEEVALGRDGERHPLEAVVNECRRQSGDITVDLAQAEARDFVEAFLDSEPNQLGAGFREMLYRQTRGHPLFTVELLRGLQERGDLVQDPAGRWGEGPSLDWATLPARVEAAIRERMDRLAGPLLSALQIASVEGEVFTAEVVTRVLGTDERAMIRRLSGELGHRHRLVKAEIIERLGSARLSRYRFGHHLFQQYLYDGLDPVERTYLHEAVGDALEELYGDQAAEIGVQLAWHFQEAGIIDKAIRYLHLAGQRAVQLSAYDEAIIHARRGLALLMSLPDSPERARRELDLRLALGMASIGVGSFTPDATTDYARARELGLQTGQTAEFCQALGEMAIFHYVRAEHRRARGLAEEALSQAQQTGDPLLEAWIRWHLGFVLFGLGEYTLAREHLEQVVDFYSSEPRRYSHPRLPGGEAGLGALSYSACCLWSLGYTEKALGRSGEALSLARQLGHAFTLCDVLCYGGCVLAAMRRDARALMCYAEELEQISVRIPTWSAPAAWHKGAAAALSGRLEEGIELMRAGIQIQRSANKRCDLPRVLGALAEAQAKAGRPAEARATLAEALRLAEETDERWWEAELHRLGAGLLLLQGSAGEAEARLCQAIGVARRQRARSLELRATTDLARLWQAQGRAGEARQALDAIYGWFTEGFDTTDLKEARAVLHELA